MRNTASIVALIGIFGAVLLALLWTRAARTFTPAGPLIELADRIRVLHRFSSVSCREAVDGPARRLDITCARAEGAPPPAADLHRDVALLAAQTYAPHRALGTVRVTLRTPAGGCSGKTSEAAKSFSVVELLGARTPHRAGAARSPSPEQPGESPPK